MDLREAVEKHLHNLVWVRNQQATWSLELITLHKSTPSACQTLQGLPGYAWALPGLFCDKEVSGAKRSQCSSPPVSRDRKYWKLKQRHHIFFFGLSAFLSIHLLRLSKQQQLLPDTTLPLPFHAGLPWDKPLEKHALWKAKNSSVKNLGSVLTALHWHAAGPIKSFNLDLFSSQPTKAEIKTHKCQIWYAHLSPYTKQKSKFYIHNEKFAVWQI